jgi:hypothetical protein
MSDTPRKYVVREGDTLLGIAVTFGVEMKDITERDEYKDLHVDRDHQDNLLPVGETLVIPPPKRGPSVSPGGSNRFKATVPMQSIAITFEDALGPLAGVPYTLELPPDALADAPAPPAADAPGIIGRIGQVAQEVLGTLGNPEPDNHKPDKRPRLDGSGTLKIDLPVSVDRFRVVFDERSVAHTIWVGHLAPIYQELGVQQRLAHLGYGAAGPAFPAALAAPTPPTTLVGPAAPALPGTAVSPASPTTLVSAAPPAIPVAAFAPVGPTDAVPQRPGDPGTFRDLEGQQGAIAAFQQSIGLEPTGFADEETREKLRKRHGV